MKTAKFEVLRWTPRLFGLLFAGFTSLFALDVFEGNHGFWPTLLALVMHLVPTFILLLLLAVAWRWELAGAVAFTGLAIFYLVAFWGRFHWSAYALISGPLFLLGALFLLSWRRRAKARMPAPAVPL
jgi:hypothetical protein